MDEKYDFALAAALVILEQVDLRPDMPKHERLAIAICSIVYGMERYEQERRMEVPQPSRN